MRRRLWLPLLLVLVLALMGCGKRTLSGKYVHESEFFGQKQTSYYDFKPGGTVYSDMYSLSGDGEGRGTYEIEGSEIRLSWLNGLEVEKGTVQGKTIIIDGKEYRKK